MGTLKGFDQLMNLVLDDVRELTRGIYFPNLPTPTIPILKAHLGNAGFPASVSIVVETPAERDAFEAALRKSGAAES